MHRGLFVMAGTDIFIDIVLDCSSKCDPEWIVSCYPCLSLVYPCL